MKIKEYYNKFVSSKPRVLITLSIALFAVVLTVFYFTSWRTCTVTFDPNVPPNTRLTYYKIDDDGKLILYSETKDRLEIWALNELKPINVTINSTINSPEEPHIYNTQDNFTYTYKFMGWYTDKQCTNLWSFYADKVTHNITLYAKWEEKELQP